jgi:hypothetical protein
MMFCSRLRTLPDLPTILHLMAGRWALPFDNPFHLIRAKSGSRPCDEIEDVDDDEGEEELG